MTKSTKILVPSGVLGLGFSEDALIQGLKRQPDIISIDGGSTDSGPFYLGMGVSKYSLEVCEAEWHLLMQARHDNKIPLIIGSCGTCGVNAGVDMMFDMTVRIAKKLGHSVKIARIYCERERSEFQIALSENRIKPLEPAPQITQESLSKITHIVSLSGVEPIQKAIEAGADVILVGRATDTALIAALPLLNNAHKGASWHAAKIAECGAFCSTNPSSGVIFVEVDETGFTVEAMAQNALCTPETVAAHMLYENADPFILLEPGGHLDVTDATYTALDARRVRVEGSHWHSSDTYTVKLEAAKLSGYQTTLLTIVREPNYVAHIDDWIEKLSRICNTKIKQSMTNSKSTHSIDFRVIGKNAVLGELEFSESLAPELGVLVIVTADSQGEADDIAMLINPYLLHLPLSEDEPIPTTAFAYSPANSSRGAFFEFALNHIEILDKPCDGFPLIIDEV